jgi:hypothetical protein
VSAAAEGWGGGPWGAAPWGTGEPDLELVGAVAVRENAVRLEFGTAPLVDGLLTPHDGSSPERYSVVAVSGVGLDGEPVRPVSPVFVEVAGVPGGGGRFVDVWVDRPFTAWPAVYRVSANNLVSASGGAFLAPGSSRTFPGVRAGKAPPTPEHAVAGKDFLIAGVASDLVGANVPGNRASKLGVLAVSSSGDYASATPLAAYRIRVIRCATAALGAFAHLPEGYGTVLAASVKRPARGSQPEAVAASIESKVRLEPETVSCTVTVTASASGVVRYRIFARARFGSIDVVVG